MSSPALVPRSAVITRCAEDCVQPRVDVGAPGELRASECELLSDVGAEPGEPGAWVAGGHWPCRVMSALRWPACSPGRSSPSDGCAHRRWDRIVAVGLPVSSAISLTVVPSWNKAATVRCCGARTRSRPITQRCSLANTAISGSSATGCGAVSSRPAAGRSKGAVAGPSEPSASWPILSACLPGGGCAGPRHDQSGQLRTRWAISRVFTAAVRRPWCASWCPGAAAGMALACRMPVSVR